MLKRLGFRVVKNLCAHIMQLLVEYTMVIIRITDSEVPGSNHKWNHDDWDFDGYSLSIQPQGSKSHSEPRTHSCHGFEVLMCHELKLWFDSSILQFLPLFSSEQVVMIVPAHMCHTSQWLFHLTSRRNMISKMIYDFIISLCQRKWPSKDLLGQGNQARFGANWTVVPQSQQHRLHRAREVAAKPTASRTCSLRGHSNTRLLAHRMVRRKLL